MITTAVPWTSWCCPGQSTFFSSAHDSEMKRLPPSPGTWRPSACAGAGAGRACCGCCCGGRGAPNGSVGPLAGLPVHSVPAAPAAVLLELDPVRGVPLRLLGLVVAPLAIRAGERDSDSYSGCHNCPLLLRVPSRR